MLSDFRFALRSLSKTPGFTAIVVLTLALGIGANATVLTWIETTLLKPFPGVRNAEEVVVLTSAHGNQIWDTVSYPDIKDARNLKEVFSGVIGSQISPACVTLNGNMEWAYAQITTANYFDVLGVVPIMGRTFLPDEDQKPGGNPVVVLAEAYWRRRFGADPAIIGKSIDINLHPFTVIGVVPASFHGTMGGLTFDFWAPLSMHHEVGNFGSLDRRYDRWLHTQARLQPGVSIDLARSAMATLAKQLSSSYAENREIDYRVLPLWKAPYGGQSIMLPLMSILMIVALGVLMVVSVNIANLLLVRAIKRQKEISIRVSLGATRRHLVQHLLAESLLLASAGGALGMLMALWAVSLLKSFMPTSHLPIGYTHSISAPTLVGVVVLTLLTGLFVGLFPAWQASRQDLHDSLKDCARGSTGGAKHHRVRSLLVISELALALVLLVGAGLCVKGLEKARQMDVGMNPKGMLVAGLRIGMNGYDEATGITFYRNLEQKLREMPGVEGAGLSSWFPLGFEGNGRWNVNVDGYERKTNEDTNVMFSIVSPGFFEAMQIKMLDGRDFNANDDGTHRNVAVINEVMAKRFWPGKDAVGRTFRAGGRDRTVIAVVKSGKYRFLSESPMEFMYIPYRQGVPDLNLGICLRTSGDPIALAGSLRQLVHSIDSRVEVWTILRMTDYVQAAYMTQVMASRVLFALGFVALLLASMGVYGVMSFVVSQRTQEFGIRMALGAQRSDVLRLVFRQGLLMAASGIGVGLALSLSVTHLLTSFLHGVSPFDLVVFSGVPIILAIVSAIACFLPAYRATQVPTVDALRAD